MITPTLQNANHKLQTTNYELQAIIQTGIQNANYKLQNKN